MRKLFASLNFPDVFVYLVSLENFLRATHRISVTDMDGVEQFLCQCYGFFRLATRELKIDDSLSPSARFAVLVHESAHAISDLVKRYNNLADRTPDKIAIIETEANLVLRFVLADLNWPDPLTVKAGKLFGSTALREQIATPSARVLADQIVDAIKFAEVNS